MIIIFVCLFVAGICGYVYSDKVEGTVKSVATRSLENWCPSSASSWDAVQIHFQCCGIESHQDWTNRSDTFKFYSLGKVTDRNIVECDDYRVPKSCCKKCEDGNCDEACGYGKNREIYESGCLDEVEHSLEGFYLKFSLNSRAS